MSLQFKFYVISCSGNINSKILIYFYLIVLFFLSMIDSINILKELVTGI